MWYIFDIVFSWEELFMSLRVGRGWGENLGERKKDLTVIG